MDTNRLNNWLTLAANLGVIAGIVFLAFEIRQSNRIALVANETEIRKSYADQNESIFTNKESAELLARAADADAEFDGTELEMLSAYVYTALNIWSAVEIGYENGMLPRQTLLDAQDDVCSYIKYYPAMHAILRSAMDDFPSGNDSKIYRTIKQSLDEANQ